MNYSASVVPLPARTILAGVTQERPHNLELEQALLGAVLTNKEAFRHVSFLRPQDFHEQLHGKLFRTIADLIAAGRVATPVTLKDRLPADIKKADVAGLTINQYLARLAAEATTILNASEYARSLVDLARRRRIIEHAEDIIAGAIAGADPDLPIKARNVFDEIAAISLPNLNGVALDLESWAKREDLAQPDYLVGHWLTTTSRILLSAPTGIGKTMFNVALGMSAAAGMAFLRWAAGRPSKVLYIDGEMSRRLLRDRLDDETRRLGSRPKSFYALSHEDVPDFAPLNTPEGQALIEALIARIGELDLIIFDNVMSLIAGDHKDEEGWRDVLPWTRSLTARHIGQLWIHHTGHDETRGYGTKTREWQMDTVIHLERVERADTDVSFTLQFRKARERTPLTRADFNDLTVALVEDAWTYAGAQAKAGKISPMAVKFLGALRDATIGSSALRMHGCPTASIQAWQDESVKKGLVDKCKEMSAVRAAFSKYKRELIAANHIACNETHAWTLK